MACDCIKRMGDQIRKEYGDSAYIDAALMFDGTMRFVLTAYYRKKKINGEYAKKESTLNLYAKYCPICGKPYNEKEVKED